MGRWIENQQEYINALQKDLDKARNAQRIITAIWPGTLVSRGCGDGRQFYVRLTNGGHVWASEDDEHLAWLAAWSALTDQGVLEAEVIREFIQKMDIKEKQ